MKGWRQIKRLGAVAAAAGLLIVICGCTTMQTTSKTQEPDVAGAQEKPLVCVNPAPLTVRFPYIAPPNSIDLCGEPVPLDRQEVYERFDKEFTLVVYNHAQVYLWLKRMERYFPAIEERLRYYNLPEDLKFVAIVESDLLPNACSPKGAAGPWQFMPSTGSAYGLAQRGSVDKRYDFERSTDSAFLLLSDLRKKYNNWALAIAAYNCGDRRILEESRVQGVRDYYDMKLPQETERYVMRILAVKAVLSNPHQYGYDLPKGWGYQELKFDRVSVSLSKPVPIQTVAAAAGTTYREIKRLNPIYRSDSIPAGNHEIKLPPGGGTAFERNFNTACATVSASAEGPIAKADDSAPAPSQAVEAPEAAPAAPKAAPPTTAPPTTHQKAHDKVYVVKKGDSLSGIATHHNVSTHELKAANKLKSDTLTPGQKLRIP
jgi:LysM repeat protein